MIVKHMPNFGWRHLAGVITVLALQALLIPKTATAANRALLIGIDDYRVILEVPKELLVHPSVVFRAPVNMNRENV